MKKTVFLLLVLYQVNALSQQIMEPKTGDIISGTVYDFSGPMMMINVTERDSANRIVSQAISDVEGRFNFYLVNPKDSIQVNYVGYETVKEPIDRNQIEIKMEYLSKNKKTVRERPRDIGIIGSKTSKMESLQKYAPLEYVCGYVIRGQRDENLCGIFLVKKQEGYSLVYKKSDKTQTRSIEPSLAEKLESSVNYKIEYIDTVRVTSQYKEGFPVVDLFYDGTTCFAVTPKKAAHFMTWNLSEDIPDDIWQEEVLKYGDENTSTETSIADDNAQHSIPDSLLSQYGFKFLGVINIPSNNSAENVPMDNKSVNTVPDSMLSQYGLVKIGVLNFPSGFFSDGPLIPDSIMSYPY